MISIVLILRIIKMPFLRCPMIAIIMVGTMDSMMAMLRIRKHHITKAIRRDTKLAGWKTKVFAMNMMLAIR
nr:MAG TPA: hypothetical protein [Caudoviricetes sp.]